MPRLKDGAPSLGVTQIIIVESDGTEILARDEIFDTGFYQINSIEKFQKIRIRRDQINDKNDVYYLGHIKAY